MGTFSVRKTKEQFIADAISVHGDKYDYSNVEYKTNATKVCIICPKHGEFWQTPNDHLRGRGCPVCKSLIYKKPIFGIGINDLILCKGSKMYKVWFNMIRRCYDSRFHIKNPTYKDCSVHKEWLILSNFKVWFDCNYKENYELDKDILVKGNKVYSPETCCFVPKEINMLLNKQHKHRGKYSVGVTKNHNKYIATISKIGVKTKIGSYDNEYDAFIAYKYAKEQYVKERAEKYFQEGKITEKVYNALLLYQVDKID